MTERTVAALEAQARRAARRAGFVARKSRWRRNSVDNRGGFMIIDQYRNAIVAGVRFELAPEVVVAWIADRAE